MHPAPPEPSPAQTADGADPARESIEQTLSRLQATRDGLSSNEARLRLDRFGPNALPRPHVSTLARLLRYFWGPIPWMIEAAALLSALVRHWPDFGIILALLGFNAGVGFWQETKASNALDALNRELALRCRALRDGSWRELDPAQLVPGDLVRVRLGDVVPADLKLIDGDYLSVDQSALTGESLPVERRAGDLVYSGSIARQGETVGVVHATGARSYL